MQIDCAHKECKAAPCGHASLRGFASRGKHRKPRRILGNCKNPHWKNPHPHAAFLKASGSASETQHKKYNQSMLPQSATTRPRTRNKKIHATLLRAGRNADNVFHSTRPARRNPDNTRRLASFPSLPWHWRRSFTPKLIQPIALRPEPRMLG